MPPSISVMAALAAATSRRASSSSGWSSGTTSSVVVPSSIADWPELNALLNRATERGYLDATFNVQRLAVNTDELWADIDLELDTERRYYFGDISIEQVLHEIPLAALPVDPKIFDQE